MRITHHYGETPPFVLLGGLMPDLLCAGADVVHAGTTDVDVQVDLEIAADSVNAKRLEQALANAEFVPDEENIWRWRAADDRVVVKFELLADQDDQPNEATLRFTECDALGAVNLRGSGWAARDTVELPLRAAVGGTTYSVTIRATGLAGFLYAKLCAAHGRSKPKDWYDLAFVLLYNDLGGPRAAAENALERFGPTSITGQVRTALVEARANFVDPSDQGPAAFSQQMAIDHPELDDRQLRADAILAIDTFAEILLSASA